MSHRLAIPQQYAENETMLASSRFAVAVHVLTLLAHRGKLGPVCSSVLAESVDTNPVVIRRLMSNLEQASLVTSSSGRNGGFLLAKSAGDINLAEIYAAVEDPQFFRLHSKANEAECPLSKAIHRALAPKLTEAADALTKNLSATRLSEICASLPQQSAAA